MKHKSSLSLWLRGSMWAVLLGLAGATTSCMTTYDAYGRPVQSVDPGVAVAGAAAAGVLGYALANDDDHHHRHYYRRPYYYGHRRGYYRY